MGIFACSIGVLERGAPVAGAMFLPTNRFLQPGVYHARHGTGLHFDGEPVNSAAPDIQSASRLSTVPGGTGGVTGPAGRRFGVARTFGSTAAELTFAAEGAVQMALFDGSRIWDVAAGVALCLAAGRAVFTRPRGARQWRRFTRFGQDLSRPDRHQDAARLERFAGRRRPAHAAGSGGRSVRRAGHPRLSAARDPAARPHPSAALPQALLARPAAAGSAV